MYSFDLAFDDIPVETSWVENAPDMLLDRRHLSKSGMRALDVLEFFGQKGSPARATDVAHALSLSTSTADQLLKTLVSGAYLIFDLSTKHYYPSPRLLRFSALLGDSYFGGERLQTFIEEAVERTGMSVSISVRTGRMMQLIDSRSPPWLEYEESPGHLFPIFNSAAGTAILAACPITTVRELIVESADQLGILAAEPDLVLERLREVRTNGHAFGGLTREVPKCAIAIALPAARYRVDLALSVRGPLEEMKANRWRMAAKLEELVASHLGQPPADVRGRSSDVRRGDHHS